MYVCIDMYALVSLSDDMYACMYQYLCVYQSVYQYIENLLKAPST